VEPTHDPAKAARRIMTDDGLNIGVLYAGDRATYPPQQAQQRKLLTVAQVEKEFEL
jgi:2-oxoglutarate ferredoxin oxidoreductase subunit beta